VGRWKKTLEVATRARLEWEATWRKISSRASSVREGCYCGDAMGSE
jgi:hypothetical protein